MELLLQHGADIKLASTVGSIIFLVLIESSIASVQNGKTALYIACSNNFVRIAYRLLRSGADSNVVDKKVHINVNQPHNLAAWCICLMQLNYTPLMYISDMEHMEPMARALLKHGASVEVADDKVSCYPYFHAWGH